VSSRWGEGGFCPCFNMPVSLGQKSQKAKRVAALTEKTLSKGRTFYHFPFLKVGALGEERLDSRRPQRGEAQRGGGEWCGGSEGPKASPIAAENVGKGHTYGETSVNPRENTDLGN